MTTFFKKLFLASIVPLSLNLTAQTQTAGSFCPELHPYRSHLFTYNMNYLPKVEVEKKNNQKLSGYVLLTTKKAAENPYYSSIELIDLQNPGMPVWFATLKENESNYIADCKLQPDGNLSFYLKTDTLKFPLPAELGENAEGIVDGYFELNNQFEPIDFFAAAGINNHDYKKFANGERLFLADDAKEMNLSKYNFNGKQLPAKVIVGFEAIVIIDKNNQEIFRWNPLDYLDFSELDIEHYSKMIDHTEDFSAIQFSRTNSISIDPIDGNILASFRRSDMCVKIERSTGKILWRLGGIKSDFALNDTSRFYLQHDIKRIGSGKYKGLYSVLNNGNEQNPGSEGLLYKLDEVNKKAKLVKRFRNETLIKSTGQGNFDIYDDTTALLNNGNANPTPETRLKVITLFKGDTVAAVLTLPKDVLVYRAVWLKNFNLPQPKISFEKIGNQLKPVTENGDKNVYWSQFDTLYNSAKDNTPRVFYKKPFGIGYLVSQSITSKFDPAVNSIVYPDAQKPDAANSMIAPVEKCEFTLNLNGQPFTLRKKFIDTKRAFMVMKP